MKNIQWGMSVTLTGDDKVKGQFKILDESLVTVTTGLNETSDSAKKAGDQLGQTGDEAKQAGAGAKKGADGFKKVGNETEKAGNKAKKSKSFWKSLKDEFFSLKGIMAGLGLGLLTSQIINVGNVTEGWNASMYAITNSHEVANQELAHSRQLAKYLGADIKSTTNAYVQFTAATKGTGLEGFKASKVFDAVSKTMRVLNRSADDTTGALKALEQMVSKGNVQAEELRGQLGERLPGAFNLAAQAMGVTTQELNKMLEQGEVLAADLLPKLADVLENKYGKGLEAAINSPAQAFRNFKNALFEFYEGLSNSLFDELATGAQALADAMNAVIPHLPSIISGLGSLVKIVGVGGALYVGYIALAGILSIVTTATAGYALASIRLQTSLVLATVQQKFFNGVLFKTIGAVGLLKTAFFSLAALYAGWEFGSWLSDNFLEARLAGFAFVRAMEVGFIQLGFVFDSAMLVIKQSWASTLNGMKSLAADFYGAIASALSAVGADELSNIYSNASTQYSQSITSTAELTASLAALVVERDKEIVKVDQTINSLVAHEIAVTKGTLALNKNVVASKKSQALKVKELTGNQKLISSLGQEIAALRLTAKEKLVNSKLSQLSADATQEEITAARTLAEVLYDQTAAYDALDLSDLTEQTNNYGNAWSNVGNTIIDTFGTMADKFANLGEMQDGYIKQLEAIKVRREEIQKNPDIEIRTKKLGELKDFENNVIKQNTQAQLGAYGSIAGAASQMFSEQSKGREALHRLEVGFMAAEMLLSIEKSILNATEAVTNAGTSGDPYSAPARVLAMAALMAGVLGAVGIAFSGGSGGGVSAADRQASQGTGTVLGDSAAQSQSISNSFERIEQLELDQYVELQEMNNGLRSLNRNISRLATQLVASFGNFNESNYGGELGSVNTGRLPGTGLLEKSLTAFDPTGIISSIIGGFSKTKKKLVDSGISIVGQTLGEIMSSGLVNAQAYFDIETKKSSFWGLSSKKSNNTEYQDLGSDFSRSLGLIFNDIGTTINESIDILGLDIAKETATFSNLINNRRFDGEGFEAYFENLTSGIAEGATRSLENFKIELPKMSFKDMSGEEIEKALQGMISQQADKMVQYLVPQIAEFQQVGEGLYDTLIRVAQEQAIFNSAMDAMGHSISGVAGMTKQAETEIAQSIIALTGGLENFREYTSTYFSEFLTDEQQFEHIKKQLTGLFDGLELSLPSTRDEFITLMDGIDRTTESGQALYAALLRMIGSLDSYYDATEKASKATEEAAKRALEAEEKLAQSRLDFTDNLTEQLARLDMEPLQIKLADLQKTFDAYREQASEYGLGTELIEALYAKKRQQIIDDALATINTTHTRELDALNREHEQSLGELNSTHKQAIDKLTTDHEQFVSSLGSINGAIANNILTIRRSFEGWDEVGYQSGQVSDLRGQIGTGTADERLSTIGKLNDALWNKYNAEIDHNNRLADLASERHQVDISRHEELVSLVNDLRDAAHNLQFGGLSTLSHTEQFSLAQSDFQRARSSGDIKNLRSSGEQYLNLAKAQYGGTASSEYQAIFEQVTNAFSSANAGSGPSVPGEILQFQQDNIALGENLVLELEALRQMTSELEAEQALVYEQSMASLNADLLEQTQILNNELALQTSVLNLQLETQTTAIVGALGGVETAIANIQVPVIPALPIFIPVPPKDEIGLPVPVDPNSAKQLEQQKMQNALLAEQLEQQKQQNTQLKANNERLELLEVRLAENGSSLERRA